MSVIAITERLELRQFSNNDAPGFYEMNKDPEVIKYTGDRPFEDLKETAFFILHYDHYEKFGYGRWAVYEKTTGVYLGFCGLKFSPDKQETDLGFRLIRKYWGRGFATEAAREALAIGFGTFDLDRIVGRARKENTASVRVLEKLGMQKKFEYEEEGESWVQYEIRSVNFSYSEKRSLPE